MICTNPSSNLRLRSGIAPVNRFLEAGIRVGLGLDEAGINDDRDMLQEMRLALRLHRVPGMDDDVPTSAQIFRMATADGAATTPFGERIGELAVGRAADLVLLPWRAISASLPRGRHAGSRRPRAPGPRSGHRPRPGRRRGRGARGSHHADRQGRRAGGARRDAPSPPHAGRGAPATARASGVPARPEVLCGVARPGVAGPLLPAELAAPEARGRRPARTRQGAPCRKRSAQPRVASRYRRPCSRLGSISLPSCHSFQLETRTQGGSTERAARHVSS